jgi:hypothetical protein
MEPSSKLRVRRPMRPPEKGVTRAWGRLAAVLASLLVAGQLANASHLLLVRHAVCPLDGELIHPGEAGGHHDAQVHAGNERSPRVAATEAPEAHHGHEHCILAAHRRDRATLHDRVVELRTPPRAIFATLSVDGTSAAARIAVHRVAPKQSPPA